MTKKKDQEIKRLRRQLEALKAQANVGISRKETKNSITTKEQIPERKLKGKRDEWLTEYVKKGLRRTAVTTIAILAVIIGFYLTQPF